MPETAFERLSREAAAEKRKGQNRSSAVMQQRAEPHDSLEDFPTPPWATRAVLRYIAENLSSERLGSLIAREPCANRGHMVRPMQEFFAQVRAADVHDYGAGFAIEDFLFPGDIEQVDWTITNPPFKLAQQFIERALATSRKGVAMIVRSAFLEGEERERTLFRHNRPRVVLQLAERAPMFKGKLLQKGSLYLAENANGELVEKRAESATAYCWLIWTNEPAAHTIFDWQPKCRLELEEVGDYPDDPEGLAILHRSKRK